MLMAYQLKHERAESDENSLWRCAKRNLLASSHRNVEWECDLLKASDCEFKFICDAMAPASSRQEDKKLSTYTTWWIDRGESASAKTPIEADQYRRLCVNRLCNVAVCLLVPQLNWPFKRALPSESRGINGTWSLYCKLNQNYSAHSFGHCTMRSLAHCLFFVGFSDEILIFGQIFVFGEILLFCEHFYLKSIAFFSFPSLNERKREGEDGAWLSLKLKSIYLQRPKLCCVKFISFICIGQRWRRTALRSFSFITSKP